jgi:glycosyltransferase involved in cell wall biosynthesis
MRLLARIFNKVCSPLRTKQGQGHIDAIDGRAVKDLNGVLEINARMSVTLSGWAIDSVSGNLADEVYICIGENEYRADYGHRRPDVARHFDNPALEYSGFYCSVPAPAFKEERNKIILKTVSRRRKKTILEALITVKTDFPHKISSPRKEQLRKSKSKKRTAPLLSIIIPCFNDGKYILETIRSVEKSDTTDYEVIIVDDGSTDEATARLIDELEIKGIQVLRQPNLGPSAARNTGIRNSRGKYLLPLDADNIIKPDFIGSCLNILETNPYIDIVYTDREEFGIRNQVVRVEDFNVQKMLYENYIDTCAIYRADVWHKCGGYDENMKTGLEDWDFWLTAHSHGFRYLHIPLPLYSYRVRENSWTMVHVNDANEAQVLNTTLYIYSKHPELFRKACCQCSERLHYFEKFHALMKAEKIPYAEFAMNRNSDESSREAAARESELFWFTPRISIVVPVYEVEPSILCQTLESVIKQIYFNWELCIGNASPSEEIKTLLNEYARVNPQIRIIHLKGNGGISENSNAALALATGEYIAPLDHDDLLAKDALFQLVKLLQSFPETDIIYTDEDKIDAEGRFCEPNFKPDWSPDLFLSMNYINHLWICRRSIFEKLGGFRKEFDGAQDYDFLLRATELTENIRHIQLALYSWRMSQGSISVNPEAKPYSQTSGINALMKAMERRKIKATVESEYRYNYKVRYHLADFPIVTIIIRASEAKALSRCIRSIISGTGCSNYEIIIAGSQSIEKQAIECQEHLKPDSLPTVRFLHGNDSVNYGAINNAAAREALGSHLLFLGEDTQVINDDWLNGMLEHAQRSEVGAVGCKLLFPDNSIGHAGIIMGIGQKKLPFHVFIRQDPDNTHFNLSNLTRNCLAVTDACLMTRKDVFNQAGGFDEKYVKKYSDIDYCLKLRRMKYLITYTPSARLFIGENFLQDTAETAEDENRLLSRWKEFCIEDPYYSANFDKTPENIYKWRGY